MASSTTTSNHSLASKLVPLLGGLIAAISSALKSAAADECFPVDAREYIAGLHLTNQEGTCRFDNKGIIIEAPATGAKSLQEAQGYTKVDVDLNLISETELALLVSVSNVIPIHLSISGACAGTCSTWLLMNARKITLRDDAWVLLADPTREIISGHQRNDSSAELMLKALHWTEPRYRREALLKGLAATEQSDSPVSWLVAHETNDVWLRQNQTCQIGFDVVFIASTDYLETHLRKPVEGEGRTDISGASVSQFLERSPFSAIAMAGSGRILWTQEHDLAAAKYCNLS